MQKTSVVCDGCGAERKSTNHWWVVKVSGDRPMFACWPWDVANNVQAVKHFCGQECAAKAFNQWMNEQVNAEVKCSER